MARVYLSPSQLQALIHLIEWVAFPGIIRKDLEEAQGQEYFRNLEDVRQRLEKTREREGKPKTEEELSDETRD